MMISLKSVLAAAFVSLAATSASAITFTVDAAASSVTLTETFSNGVCNFTSCGVSADLAAGLDGTTFELTDAGDASSFDFLTFSGNGFGVATYDVVATLAFDPPNLSTTSGGSGGALLFFGSIVSGNLSWDDVPASYVLGDGSEVTVDFQDGFGLFLGSSYTTSASVTLDEVAPVPLPASALMLLLGLGGLAGVRRLKTNTAS